jgi:hypothetical protein
VNDRRDATYGPRRASRESVMDSVAPKIIEILRKHMKSPDKDITLETKLEELEI